MFIDEPAPVLYLLDLRSETRSSKPFLKYVEHLTSSSKWVYLGPREIQARIPKQVR